MLNVLFVVLGLFALAMAFLAVSLGLSVASTAGAVYVASATILGVFSLAAGATGAVGNA